MIRERKEVNSFDPLILCPQTGRKHSKSLEDVTIVGTYLFAKYISFAAFILVNTLFRK